jgi:hypothetical protein
MLKKNRTSRVNPLRRTLTVEALEDRTLLNGVVRAALVDGSGVLQITGDDANNQFTISPAPDTAYLRVQGVRLSFTAINGVTFVDFLAKDITDINMNLGAGKDNVTLSGFNITGQLTINYNNAADVFAMPGFTAKNTNLNLNGTAGNGGSTGTGTGTGGTGTGTGTGGTGTGTGTGGTGTTGSGNNTGLRL